MGGVRSRVIFDANVSCYLEKCIEMERKIAEAKDSINELNVSLTLFSSLKPYFYLNCGSTTKLTLPFKIRAKHTRWKRRPAYRRKEVCAVLGRTFFLASHCLFPFISMMSLHYKTEPLLRASSLQGYITPVLAVTHPPTNPSHFLVGPQGSCALLPLVTQN